MPKKRDNTTISQWRRQKLRGRTWLSKNKPRPTLISSAAPQPQHHHPVTFTKPPPKPFFPVSPAQNCVSLHQTTSQTNPYPTTNPTSNSTPRPLPPPTHKQENFPNPTTTLFVDNITQQSTFCLGGCASTATQTPAPDVATRAHGASRRKR